MVEFEVDMDYLLDEGEMDSVMLFDENGVHDPVEYVREVTCENKVDWEDGFNCSNCNARWSADHVHRESFRHCPYCGAKVM